MKNVQARTSIDDREKIVKEIAKTSELIRKKYRALKTGKIEEDVALEKQFKPITEPLKQLVENTIETNALKIEPFDESGLLKKEKIEPLNESGLLKRKKIKAKKRTNISMNESMEQYAKEIDSKQQRLNESLNDAPITSTPILSRAIPSIQLDFEQPSQSAVYEQAQQPLYEQPIAEEIMETTPNLLVSSVRRELQTPEGQSMLREQFGPLGQEYMGAILGKDKEQNKDIDYVYGVKFTDDGITLGAKQFYINKNDDIFIDGIEYAGTEGLYELIFKRYPNDENYTEDDLRKYKSILIATNVHRHKHDAEGRLKSNKGYKYTKIIGPLFSNKTSGKGILPRAMTVSDKKIDYVHWDDPNELVDRLRLLDASRRAGNNAHDNEIMSIIEELREAGLIIN